MNAKRERPRIIYSLLRNAVMPDCDCACSVESVSPPTRPDADLWVAAAPAYVADLETPEPWRLHYTPQGRAPIAILNAPAERLWRSFSKPSRPADVTGRIKDQPADLIQDAFSRLLEAGLLRPADQIGEKPDIGHAHTFTTWLHLTDMCNLHCPYCYVHKHDFSMEPATAQRTVGRLVEISAEHGYHHLHLKYAGGEPTLNFEVLRAAHTHARQLASRHDIELTGVVMTNGVAVDETMVDFFAETGLRVAVSLDGGPEAHNRLRALTDGEGTYRRVTDLVDRALASDIPVSISITLTGLNLKGCEKAVRFALERQLPFNLNFYRGLGRTAAALSPKSDALIAALRRCFAVMENHLTSYPRPFTGILDRARFDLYHRYSCSAGRHYVSVNQEGAVAPCQMLLDHPVVDISSPQFLDSLRAESRALVDRPVESSTTCRTCPWRYACGGGCPLLRGTALHARYCRVYRALYPDLVYLEGQRLAAHEANRTR